MRIAFALPGFHRVDRGAEVALMAIATELAKAGERITLFGSGPTRQGTPYHYRQVPSVPRERFEKWPRFPPLRSETSYEEVTFAAAMASQYRPQDFDVTVTCSYPFTNWLLRRPSLRGVRPAHVFVTQNGDWPARAKNSEYRFFDCDGLVCINPDYYAANRDSWRCALIPNGVDVGRFTPGAGSREAFGLPANAPIVLMVSALIPTKRVIEGIRSVSMVPNAHLVVAGDGPDRSAVDNLANAILPHRFTRMTVSQTEMPALYRSADVFLHLSKLESFGNVFIEALATGLPIVGEDSPRLRWIVGDDEYLVDTSQPETIAEGIRSALCSESSSNARQARALGFSWSTIGAKYLDFFETLLSERRQ